MRFEEILSRVQTLVFDFFAEQNAEMPPRFFNNLWLVVTGGEPLLQPNLTGFLTAVHRLGYQTQIESNGLIYRDIPADTILVVSPKVNEKTRQQIKLDARLMERVDYLKFILSKTEEGYQDIPDFGRVWLAQNPGKLFVSPMNAYLREPAKSDVDSTLETRSAVDERVSFWTPGLFDIRKNQENHEHAALIAMLRGARLTLQQHLYAGIP